MYLRVQFSFSDVSVLVSVLTVMSSPGCLVWEQKVVWKGFASLHAGVSARNLHRVCSVPLWAAAMISIFSKLLCLLTAGQKLVSSSFFRSIARKHAWFYKSAEGLPVLVEENAVFNFSNH